ncbi:MAG: hypothetical protein U9Q33_10790, partial [Campylobacterota bacterium]|nr:hypothetical protein [Campylobacterota bacterium]
EPAPEPEEPVPEPIEIIDENGRFDEDPTDNDIDIAVVDIADNGKENSETITDTQTKKEATVWEKPTEDENIKEYTLELKDNESGEVQEQTIVVKNPESVITTTETGTRIEAKVEDEQKEVETKLELNENGTSISTVVVKDKETGESKAGALATFIPIAPETNEDGSVTVTKDDLKLEVKSDGSTEHTITLKDEAGNELGITKAKSEADNSVVILLEDGTVQTKTKQIKENGEEISSVVDGKGDGTAVHMLKILDSNGDEVVTKAESKIVGAQTIISPEGEVETSVDVSDSLKLIVVAKEDGTSEHTVSTGDKVTKVKSSIKGAQTVIDTNAEVETKVQTNQTKVIGGTEWIFEAVATTASSGKTVTTFQLRNTTTDEIKEPQNTFVPETPYDKGNEVDIVELEGIIYFKTTSPVSSELVVE